MNSFFAFVRDFSIAHPGYFTLLMFPIVVGGVAGTLAVLAGLLGLELKWSKRIR